MGSIAPYHSDPVTDPNKVYPHVPGLPYHAGFALKDEGLPCYHVDSIMLHLKGYLLEHQENFLGYQCNQNVRFSHDLGYTLDMHVNNIGDAFEEGNFRTNSKAMERAVLDYYARLWNAEWAHIPIAGDQQTHDPIGEEAYWGFCLTMGATEGNLYGMWNARDYLSGKKLLLDEKQEALVYRQLDLASMKRSDATNEFTPVAFYSEDTHYSLAKAMKMLDISTFSDIGTSKYEGQCPIQVEGVVKGEWPAQVPSTETGEIDIEALASLVDFFASNKHPILVNFNYGTTFKGAYDDVKACGERLVEILKKYDMYEREFVDYKATKEEKASEKRYGFWFHVDGALGASYMPFIKMAYAQNLISETGPDFDFVLPFVMSISTSGHKWPGSPVPCGIYMSKNKYRIDPPSRPEYTGVDTTFAGSRNGLSVMALWSHLARTSYKDQISRILEGQRIADYAFKKLLELEAQLGLKLYVAHTKLSLTVRFRRPINQIIQKYSLSNETLKGIDYSHIFIMPHVTTSLVDRLLADLNSKDSFPLTNKSKKVELIAAQRGHGFK